MPFQRSPIAGTGWLIRQCQQYLEATEGRWRNRRTVRPKELDTYKHGRLPICFRDLSTLYQQLHFPHTSAALASSLCGQTRNEGPRTCVHGKMQESTGEHRLIRRDGKRMSGECLPTWSANLLAHIIRQYHLYKV